MNIRFGEIIYRGFWSALDWIYPPVCVGCGEPGYRLCSKCRGKIKFIQGSRCKICGRPIDKPGELCKTCQITPPPYKALRSMARYEGIMRECIHSLKYDHNQSLGEYFCRDLLNCVKEEDWLLDMVIPVPLSPFRIKERGYNQSALIARPLAMALSLRYQPFGLKRIRNTQSQVELTAEERRINVAGAFQAVPELVRGKAVLLVDDVTTTGSTLIECTRALNSAGARAVYCLTLARPIHDEDFV